VQIHYALDDYMVSLGAMARQLWTDAGLGPNEVSVAQLYDGFSPIAYYWLEAAGFCPEGEAHRFVQNGRISLSGSLPVNTAGGSLSEGRLHGMGHLAEAARQVRGRAGRRQVQDCHAAFSTDGFHHAGAVVLTREP
jgi:acetyl-CoA acetyltransferase